MYLIFDNQLSIFEDIFYKYLNPKQCTKLYTSNLILYNIYLTNNKFEDNYFMPKDRDELKNAVYEWCDYKEEAILEYGHISNWNTINITRMNLLFWHKYNFNDDISDWNTSKVTTMRHMFCRAYRFNQQIDNWDVSNVIDMGFMFCNAKNFNQSIINDWNICNSCEIEYMFKNNVIDNII